MSTQPQTTAVMPVGAGTVARQDVGGAQALERTAETASALLAAQAEAMVKARFTVALRRTRDWDDVRTKLLKACERPGFAGSATNEKTWGAAWFRKPVGEGVEGFSIRFAEEAVRCMGNIDVEPTTLYEDDQKRIIRLSVLDLESNVAYHSTIVVEKTVVRRFLKKGEEALRVMVNSRGETTYLMPATDDDMLSKQNNLISKAVRNGVLRLVPGDIQAECRTRILAIRHGEAAKDPDAFRRKVVDGFAKLNVLPSHLKEMLGHDLAQASPAELTDLRELWQAIDEGRTTWAEALQQTKGDEATESTPATKPGLAGLTEKLKAEAPAATTQAATTTPAAKGCSHPAVPPSKVAALKYGQAIACVDCGEELRNPEAKPEPVVHEPVRPAGQGKGRQGRLQE